MSEAGIGRRSGPSGGSLCATARRADMHSYHERSDRRVRDELGTSTASLLEHRPRRLRTRARPARTRDPASRRGDVLAGRPARLSAPDILRSARPGPACASRHHPVEHGREAPVRNDMASDQVVRCPEPLARPRVPARAAERLEALEDLVAAPAGKAADHVSRPGVARDLVARRPVGADVGDRVARDAHEADVQRGVGLDLGDRGNRAGPTRSCPQRVWARARTPMPEFDSPLQPTPSKNKKPLGSLKPVCARGPCVLRWDDVVRREE